MNRKSFRPQEFLPRVLFDRITDIRVARPQVIDEEAGTRRPPATLTRDGRLVLLAADHPARMVLRAGDDAMAMGDRWSLLARILRVAAAPECDGVMATPDVLEELLILNRLDRELGGPGFLDGKVLVGSMNRGGLAGTAFELDDRMTAFTVDRIAALRLDGAKVMFQLEAADPMSGQTLAACAQAITACHARRLPVFVEALMVKTVRGIRKVVKTPDALVHVVNVASALGASSALTWLKVPFCPQFERVARATTCPILLLGGESRGDPAGLLREVATAMRAGPTVRGALVGRGVTFPGPRDPLAAAAAISAIVHRGASADEAAVLMAAVSGRETDRFSKLMRA